MTSDTKPETIDDTPKLNPYFNTLSPPAPVSAPETGLAHKPDAALVVDIQLGCVALMDRQDASNYLDSLAKSLEDMRESGIEICWMTMSDRNQLHEPAKTLNGDQAPTRGTDALRKMDFFAAAPGSEPKNADIFEKFMDAHGPRTNEPVYQKYFFDAFATPDDAAGKPGLRQILESEKGTAYSDKPEAFANGKTLAEYLNAGNAQNLLVMGITSTHCSVGTALGGAQKGFNTTLCTDQVVSWTGNDHSRLSWRGDTGATEEWNKYHETKMQDRLGEIVADPKREFSVEQTSAAKNVGFSTFENIRESMTGIKPGNNRVDGPKNDDSAPSAPRATGPSQQLRR